MYDFAIVGGGIVGLAAAHALGERQPGASIVVLEKQAELAEHQTGHNSGVIHSGIYYRPGSLKARNCRAGIEKLQRFCDANGVGYELCGKVVVATSSDERDRLRGLAERGRQNGVPGLRLISREELRDVEPHADGVEALLSPSTGIIRFREVALALARRIVQSGGEVRTGVSVVAIEDNRLSTSDGEVEARRIVCCAGLHADRVVSAAGVRSPVLILGFRGEYYRLKPERRSLVRNLIYPVPDPRYPFLGVHFTRRRDGTIEAGPNAVLAWAREGYRRTDFDWRDARQMLAYPGFWRMGFAHLGTAIGEYHRSFSKRAFVAGLRKLVPDVEADDLEPGGAGVRAMALGPDGALIDDFRIERHGHVVHVLNAPSPAATSSLAIGAHIAKLATE